MAVAVDELYVLFEGAPRFVARLAVEAQASWNELLDRAEEIALAMPEDEQFELLNAHPRIGADPAAVSALSHREQGYGRDPGTAQLALRLERLNDEYEHRFGFRFVVFVNGRSRAAIADLIDRRLDAPRDDELQRALRDVVAIARNRRARLAQ